MPISVKTFPRIRPQDYATVRPKINSGDILLCSGSAFFSNLIKKTTKSVWSHVGFVLKLEKINRIMVLESVESIGVRTVPLSHYVKDYKGEKKGYPGRLLIARHRDFESIVTDLKLRKMTQFAVDLLGYPYDNDEIFRIARRIAKSWFGYKEGDVERDEEYICSEYAWECYNRVGLNIPYNRLGIVTPKDFAMDKKVDPVAVLKVKQ